MGASLLSLFLLLAVASADHGERWGADPPDPPEWWTEQNQTFGRTAVLVIAIFACTSCCLCFCCCFCCLVYRRRRNMGVRQHGSIHQPAQPLNASAQGAGYPQQPGGYEPQQPGGYQPGGFELQHQPGGFQSQTPQEVGFQHQVAGYSSHPGQEQIAPPGYSGYPSQPPGYPQEPPGNHSQPSGYPQEPPGYPSQPPTYPAGPPEPFPSKESAHDQNPV